MDVDLVDPCIDPDEAYKEYGINVLAEVPSNRCYLAVAVAVAHRQFTRLSINQWQHLLQPGGVLLDLKGVLPRELDPLRI